MTSTPLILASGALGSGKTTFVHAVVVANPNVRFGVIVNEFGETGVDGDLLRPYVPQIVEIRNGCICCATQDQFVPAIKELLARYMVDVLIVEMSGAGDPLPVTRNLRVLQPMIELRKQIVLADATAEPAAMTREHSFRNSLAVADLAVMTKTDIASQGSIAAWRDFLAGFAGGAQVVEAAHGNVPLPVLLGAGSRERSTLPTFVPDPHRHSLVSICHFIHATTRDRLQKFTDSYGSDVERFKGVLWVDGVLMEVQGVRGHLTLAPYRGAPSRGRLVFISSVLARTALRAAVTECFTADATAAPELSLDLLTEMRSNGNAMPETAGAESWLCRSGFNGRPL